MAPARRPPPAARRRCRHLQDPDDVGRESRRTGLGPRARITLARDIWRRRT